MSNARNLARLIVDSGGDLDAGNLGNAPNPINAGTIAYLGMSTAPTGWLKANGAAITTAAYPELYAAIGSQFNIGGEPAGTFRLPDLRGEFIRSLDDGRGVDNGRVLGSHQKGSIMMISSDHEMIMGNSKTSQFWDNGEDITWIDHERLTANLTDNGKSASPFSQTIWDVNIGTSRPRNNALLACIKY